MSQPPKKKWVLPNIPAGESMEVVEQELTHMGTPVCNPVRERRYGRFKINLDHMAKDDDLLVLFNGLIVLSAYADPCSFDIKYHAAHPSFERVPEGHTVPKYKVKFTKSRRGVGMGNSVNSTEYEFIKLTKSEPNYDEVPF